ncbi:MAG: delta-60 repeat domain-containing protein [Chlorobium sp.]
MRLSVCPPKLVLTCKILYSVEEAGYSNNYNIGPNDNFGIVPYNFDFVLARYNNDGSLDTTFSEDGKVTTDFGFQDEKGCSIIIQSDGKILVAGYTGNYPNRDFAIVRYNSDGSLDWSDLAPTIDFNQTSVDLDLIGIVKGDVDGSWAA